MSDNAGEEDSPKSPDDFIPEMQPEEEAELRAWMDSDEFDQSPEVQKLIEEGFWSLDNSTTSRPIPSPRRGTSCVTPSAGQSIRANSMI
jgi:hypothetical protein